AFLNPERKVGAHIAGAESASLISGREFDERKHPDHRTRAVLVFIDKTIFEAEFGIAKAGLHRAASRTVEGYRGARSLAPGHCSLRRRRLQHADVRVSDRRAPQAAGESRGL